MLSAVFRSTIVQLATPDELRGRVTSIHMLVVTSGPRLGDVESATVAAIAGTQFAVVSGGLLVLVGVAAVVRAFPELMAHVLPTTRVGRSEGDRSPGPPAASGADAAGGAS